MNLDRKTNQILKHADLYGVDSEFRKMVDNTVTLTLEMKYTSARAIDDVYGTIAVDDAERGAHGA
jgi:hypothetical protein